MGENRSKMASGRAAKQFCCFSGLPTRGIRDEMSLFRLMENAGLEIDLESLPGGRAENQSSRSVIFSPQRSFLLNFPSVKEWVLISTYEEKRRRNANAKPA